MGYHKLLYAHTPVSNIASIAYGTYCMGQLRDVRDILYFNDFGWSDVYDGNWHFLEYHMKMDTQSSPYNGIVEFWLDGVKSSDVYTDVNYSDGDPTIRLGWTGFEYPSNENSPDNGECYYYDQDDIAIWTSGGPIGPLGNGSPSVSPNGLKIKNITRPQHFRKIHPKF